MAETHTTSFGGTELGGGGIRPNLRPGNERTGRLGPLAPRRGASNRADRTSAGRGDARGVGYRQTSEFSSDSAVFATTRDPTPLSSPRPVRVCSVLPLVWEHGARGPARRACILETRQVGANGMKARRQGRDGGRGFLRPRRRRIDAPPPLH